MNRLRDYDAERDYATIRDWWLANGMDAPPAYVLPPTGAVIENEAGRLMAASFVYLNNSAMAYVAFTSCDPTMSPRETFHSAEVAMKAAIEIGRRHVGERGVIWTCSHLPSMHRMAVKRCGFTDTGPAATGQIQIGGEFSTDCMS